MKIAAPSVILNYDVRKDTAISLAAGEPVLVAGTSGHEADAVSKMSLSPELSRTVITGQAAITTIRMNKGARHEFKRQGIEIGAGAGALIGAGVGILLQQLKQIHPSSALAVDAACVLIGAGLGGAVGSGQFEVEPAYDGKEWSMKIRSIA
jgi:hypothetical protein